MQERWVHRNIKSLKSLFDYWTAKMMAGSWLIWAKKISYLATHTLAPWFLLPIGMGQIQAVTRLHPHQPKKPWKRCPTQQLQVAKGWEYWWHHWPNIAFLVGGFDSPTSGLWAQHAFATRFCTVEVAITTVIAVVDLQGPAQVLWERRELLICNCHHSYMPCIFFQDYKAFSDWIK